MFKDKQASHIETCKAITQSLSIASITTANIYEIYLYIMIDWYRIVSCCKAVSHSLMPVCQSLSLYIYMTYHRNKVHSKQELHLQR